MSKAIAACDRELVLLRAASRKGPPDEREFARLMIDHVLERRTRLLVEQSRMGAQS